MGDALESHGVELIVCAGYDAILSPGFIDRFEGKVINIHPSLLPAFAGSMDAIRLALEAGVEETGCTVHLVTNQVDSGPIIAQSRVGVLPGDTLELLAARIHAAEHRLLPEVVRRLAAARLASATPAMP
jgi:phosphoribosylglycinamide formyltransferase-1